MYIGSREKRLVVRRCGNMATPIKAFDESLSGARITVDAGGGQQITMRAPRGWLGRVCDVLTGQSARRLEENKKALETFQRHYQRQFIAGGGKVEIQIFDIAKKSLDSRVVNILREAMSDARVVYLATVARQQLKDEDVVLGSTIGEVKSNGAKLEEFVDKLRNEIEQRMTAKGGPLARTITSLEERQSLRRRLVEEVKTMETEFPSFQAPAEVGEGLDKARQALSRASHSLASAERAKYWGGRFLGDGSALVMKLAERTLALGETKKAAARRYEIECQIEAASEEIKKQNGVVESCATRLSGELVDHNLYVVPTGGKVARASAEVDDAVVAARTAAKKIAELLGEANPRSAEAQRKAEIVRQAASAVHSRLVELQFPIAEALYNDAVGGGFRRDYASAMGMYMAAADHYESIAVEYANSSIPDGDAKAKAALRRAAEMRSLVGEMCERQGDYAAAAQTLKEVANALHGLVIYYEYGPEPDRAQATAIRREIAEVLSGAARNYLKINDHAKAAERYEEAATVYWACRETAKTVEAYGKAATARSMHAQSLAAAGNREGAIGEYEKAVVEFRLAGERTRMEEALDRMVALRSTTAQSLLEEVDHAADAEEYERIKTPNRAAAADEYRKIAMFYDLLGHGPGAANYYEKAGDMYALCDYGSDSNKADETFRGMSRGMFLEAANIHASEADKRLVALDYVGAAREFTAEAQDCFRCGEAAREMEARELAQNNTRRAEFLHQEAEAWGRAAHSPFDVIRPAERRMDAAIGDIGQGLFASALENVRTASLICGIGNMQRKAVEFCDDALRRVNGYDTPPHVRLLTEFRAMAAKATISQALSLAATRQRESALAVLKGRSPEDIIAEAHCDQTQRHPIRRFAIVEGAALAGAPVSEGYVPAEWGGGDSAGAVLDDVFLDTCRALTDNADSALPPAQLNPLLSLYHNMAAVAAYPDRQAATIIANKLKDEILGLRARPGERFLFPCGIGEDAMFCSIEKKADGNYRIGVFKARAPAAAAPAGQATQPFELFFDNVTADDLFFDRPGAKPLDLQGLVLMQMTPRADQSRMNASIRECFLGNRRLAEKLIPPERRPTLLAL